MKGMLNGLKFLVKWGAYIFIFVEIFEFAHDKFAELAQKNGEKDVEKLKPDA